MTQTKKFSLSRVVDAPLELVWKAHTEAEHLMEWWGPKELKMKTATIDLQPGGLFHYGMEAPNGEELWGKFVYREIVPQQKLVFISSFSDAQGETTLPPMAQGWPPEILNTITFEEQDGKTHIHISGHPINASESEEATYFANIGSMKTGFGGTYDQLDTYMASVQ